MDVIFYFVISLLVVTVASYFIFWLKNDWNRKDIEKEILALQTVGTTQQKDQEKEAVAYKQKINDFAYLLSNHKFTSNVLALVREQTMPNVWFKQFDLSQRENGVRLFGEADNMDDFSRQVLVFENNKYVKNINVLSSNMGASARVDFNLDLSLDQSVLDYPAVLSSITQTTTPSNQPVNQQGQGGTVESEKGILSFKVLLEPEVVGEINETNHTVLLKVPVGTDLKNLTPAITVSLGASVLPASNVLQDFTNPVTYSVTAQDGSIQDYEVTAVENVQQQAENKTGQSGSETLILIVLVSAIIIVIVVIVLALKRFK